MAVLLSLPVCTATSSSTGERWAAVTLLAFCARHNRDVTVMSPTMLFSLSR